MTKSLMAIVAIAMTACAASHRPAVEHPAVVGRSQRGARTLPDGPVVGEYAIVYDGKASLSVEATFPNGVGETFAVEGGAEPFLKDFEVATTTATGWEKGVASDRSFVAKACLAACRIRYRYALRDAAKKVDDLDIASEEGDVIEAPPSTWLLTPQGADASARVRFRVKTESGASFVTGVFRAGGDDAWEIAIGDLWTSPYSAFGPLRIRPIKAGGARVELAIAPGKLQLTDDELVTWAESAAKSILTYFGTYPMPEALVLLIPSHGRWVGEGKTLAGGGGAIFMRVGEQANARALREDWVLVHEMTHLAFPSVAREHTWAEEGLATYVEPFARARAGNMTEAEAWFGLVDGVPNGLPGSGDRGLDRTPTWGRTYWGGALFYLLADIEIRKRTQNRFGLEHALRGVLAAGGNNAHRWSLEDAFAADKAIGVPVLRELHEAMGNSPHPVDLDGLWRELGVVKTGATVRFDEKAPLAEVRRAITTP